MKDSRHIDGFSIGSKLKGAWSKLSPEAQGTTISFVAAATLGGVYLLANYLNDRRIIKKIQSGEIQEEDLVRKAAKKILDNLNNTYMDYNTAQLIMPIINGIKTAKTFKELRSYFDSEEIRKMEQLYIKAKRSSEAKMLTTHDSMPWVKKINTMGLCNGIL